MDKVMNLSGMVLYCSRLFNMMSNIMESTKVSELEGRGFKVQGGNIKSKLKK